MQYLSIFDNITGKRLAFLENAYNVSYTKNLNLLWTGSFSLPLTDPKNKYCRALRWVEMWDGSDYVGLFRIIPSSSTKNANTKSVTYQLEHILSTLIDDVMAGWHEIGNIGVYTPAVLRYVLGFQSSPRWALYQCQFQRQFLYGWENENLLAALLSVPQSFTEPYRWDFNTQVTPWQLSLNAVNRAPVAEIRYRKNQIGITKTEDPTQLCTRLIPLGYGEGVNQLDITSVNNGVKYLEADTVNTYGVITRFFIDRRYQNADSLKAAAQAMLDELKTPYISYTVDAVQDVSLRRASVGDYVRVIDDEDGVDFLTQVISINKPDVYGAPDNIKITLATKARDVASSIADLADRQRINEVYSQGAVTLYTRSFADNCSASYPATLRFPIPENVVHINEILLEGRATAFRAYEQAIGSATIDLTTTGSGGGSVITSASGGGSTETSEEVELEPQNAYSDDGGGYGSANHNHGIDRGTRLAVVDWDTLEVIDSVGWVPSGAHTHEGHSHEVDIPSHRHNVTVPAHTHSITMPSHSHSIGYGIYTGSTASKLTIAVDGNTVGTFNSPLSSVNLVPYLAKNEDGTIRRGWHTVTITPNNLTRVELDMVIQLFANSRGGGQF